MEVEEPFATPDDLRARWRGMPDYTDETLGVELLDASQLIVDICPAAAKAPMATLRKITCDVVKRSLEAEQLDVGGYESIQQGAGPYQETIKPLNPHGDMYLTSSEKKRLGGGKQSAFSIDLAGGSDER